MQPSQLAVMACEQVGSLVGFFFWCLPLFAVYWIHRRKRLPGASIALGRRVLILWALTFPVVILSLFAGFSKLEGNAPESQCVWIAVAAALLATAYGLLFRTLGRA